MIVNKTPYGAMVAEIVALIPSEYRYYLDRITVQMSSSLRTTGGQSVWTRYTGLSVVSLNASMFAKIDDAARREILSHEIAHAVLQVNGIFDQHGPVWQRLHRTLGGSAVRCHDHDVKCNLIKRWICVRQSDAKHVRVLTKAALNRFSTLYRDAVNLGVILVDRNTMCYKWLSVASQEVKSIKPLDEKKWKLVA